VKRTVILAWGNDFHQDDGAGRRAATALRDLHLPHTDIHDFNQLVPEHAELLLEADRVIFLDAFPAEPGQGALLLPLHDQAAICLPRSCFGHAIQPTEVATLAAELYGAQPESWLAAIPGFHFDLGEDLSEATQAGIRDIVAKIAGLVR
jgi:hydrogenase maturation protease